MKKMWLVFTGGIIISILGCSGSQGECTYDTDCPQLGYSCNPQTHRCELNDDYDRIKDKRCNNDLDCDPILEYCDPATNLCVHKEFDGGQSGDDGPTKPDNPACAGIDEQVVCAEAGLQGQGRDRDGDSWGECCDCDDYDPKVHPGASEVIYNSKDDDCNPSTPDGDVDQDGHLSVLVGGDDCDDRDPSVYPGAEEKCDGKDNDCDGIGDPADLCGGNDGGTGGDTPPQCPDIGGIYNINAYCMQISSADGVHLNQEDCNLSFNLDAINCTGTIDNAMNLYIQCAGLGFPCQAKASLTSTFQVICSEQCKFDFIPADTGTSCDFHSDPECTNSGKVCGILGNNSIPTPQCVDVIPGGRQPGYYCNSNENIYCVNSLCLENYCGAICTDDSHCSSFAGMSCETVTYNDGQGTVGPIQTCAPENTGETICGRTADCPSTRVCSYRPLDDQVITVCKPPNQNGALPGESCNANADCKTNICVCGDQMCDGSTSGVCSAICTTDDDCVQSNMCSSIYIPDNNGMDHVVDACIPDPNSCARNADCPAGNACRLTISTDGTHIETECGYGAGPNYDNTGEPCGNDGECFSVWCNPDEHYCNGFCVSDDDCPTYEDSPASCSSDGNCTLLELCNDSSCNRKFECATEVFWLGLDNFGNDIYDTANMCRPIHRPCGLDEDCRDGEACELDYNSSATVALYYCKPGIGPGQMGDDCSSGGANACWTGLCIIVNGGQESYCSEACQVAADCGDITKWDCQDVRVDIRPGIVSYVPACIKL